MADSCKGADTIYVNDTMTIKCAITGQCSLQEDIVKTVGRDIYASGSFKMRYSYKASIYRQRDN